MFAAAFKETNAQGFTLKIVHDDDAENPIECDSAVIMAVLHRRYVNPAASFKGADLSSVEGIEEFETANAADDSEYAVFPLFMYDHSGTIYRPSRGGNPFSCPWDSGRVGIIAVKRSEIGTTDAFDVAESTAKVYTDWANGNAWGYVIENPEGDVVDSCWGFVGDSDESYLMETARNALLYSTRELTA